MNTTTIKKNLVAMMILLVGLACSTSAFAQNRQGSRQHNKRIQNKRIQNKHIQNKRVTTATRTKTRITKYRSTQPQKTNTTTTRTTVLRRPKSTGRTVVVHRPQHNPWGLSTPKNRVAKKVSYTWIRGIRYKVVTTTVYRKYGRNKVSVKRTRAPLPRHHRRNHRRNHRRQV